MADLTPAELREKLVHGPMLFDGAMGTQLMEAGVGTGECGVAWNVDKPEAIEAIHRRYLDAGCDFLTTNTFQGSREALGMHGLSDRAAELNRAGAEAARRAAGADALVAADIGPFGGFLEPLGPTTEDELIEIFREQLKAQLDGGADVALVETMSDPNEATKAIAAAKAVGGAMGDWPVISTYAFQKPDDRFVTMMGTSAGDAVRASLDSGADVVGANCGSGLDLEDYVRLVEALAGAAGDTPVMIQPNAGSPVDRDGELSYPATPADMAAIVPRLVSAGAAIVGGCCGTTPDHLAAMRKALDATTA